MSKFKIIFILVLGVTLIIAIMTTKNPIVAIAFWALTWAVILAILLIVSIIGGIIIHDKNKDRE